MAVGHCTSEPERRTAAVVDNLAHMKRTAEVGHSHRPILVAHSPAVVVAAAAAALKNHTNWVHSTTVPAAVAVLVGEQVVRYPDTAADCRSYRPYSAQGR